jgi:antirestriction protein ArdC
MSRRSSARSEEERAARRSADRDRLEQAARELLSSDGWQRWVRVRATNGLARYSLHNQLLIALQKPDATFVAGFRAFLKLNRCVRKGEKAIRILAPMTVRQCDAQDADDDQRRTVFRSVAVFDVGQTDPLPGRQPVPLSPPAEPICGDSHADLLTPLENFAAELGYAVRLLPLEGSADGWCDPARQEIVVNERLAGNAQVRVLVHELAHALGLGYRDLGRRRAEVLVDSVTYIVCGSVGLDVGGESIPYVAGWGEDGELEAIRAYAQTIDDVARRLEPAITAADGDDQQPPARLAA